MSLDSNGLAFCVVCGRFDREFIQRKSGLKCSDCVGKSAKREYTTLQQQQATYMLLSMSNNGSNTNPARSPSRANSIHSGSNSRRASFIDGGGGGAPPPLSLGGVSPGASVMSPTHASSFRTTAVGPISVMPLEPPRERSSSLSSPQSKQQGEANHTPPVPVDLSDVQVTVEKPEVTHMDADHKLPFVKASVKTQQCVTLYTFSVRRKYCPHETVPAATTDGGAAFSLMCPDCTRPVTTRKHRFSHAYRVLTALKHIGRDTLPKLPDRPIRSSTTPEFLERRRMALEEFVQAALSNSFFSRHPQLLDLLGIVERTADAESDELGDYSGEAASPLGGTANSVSMSGSPFYRSMQHHHHHPHHSHQHSLGDAISPEALIGWKRGACIGRGAFGSVYLGLLPTTSQLLAVKVLPLQDVDSNEIRNVEHELLLLRTLRHQNVVRLHGALRDDSARELCIFTEYVECGSVARMVSKFGSLPPSVMQRYLRQVLLGLCYLHDKGVVHRDVKGDNLLVSKEGHVKLADFGCSASLSQIAAANADDATGGMMANLTGTPLWMSPEAMRGEPLTGAADIWSFGCVGIEMLGRSPWNMSPKENVYTAIYRFQKCTTLPDGFPQTDEEAPASLRDMLRGCLQRDPEARPSPQRLLMHPFFTEDFVSAATSIAGRVVDDDSSSEMSFASPSGRPSYSEPAP